MTDLAAECAAAEHRRDVGAVQAVAPRRRIVDLEDDGGDSEAQVVPYISSAGNSPHQPQDNVGGGLQILQVRSQDSNLDRRLDGRPLCQASRHRFHLRQLAPGVVSDPTDDVFDRGQIRGFSQQLSAMGAVRAAQQVVVELGRRSADEGGHRLDFGMRRKR